MFKEGKFGVINSKYNAAHKGKEKVKSLMHYKTKVKPQELLDMYLKDLEKMGEHIFLQIWQLYMFLLCKVNLQDNQIVIVQDFARNFLLDCQNEPQSLHWDHDQVTLMPSVAYYNCPEKEYDGLVTEEAIHITPDLKHDTPAVQYFTAATLAYVTSQGVNFNEAIELTDQCPTQYKSKAVFYNMFESEIKHMHHYFAARHGKNPADETTGRTKTSYNMLTGKGKTINGKCNHKRMCFKYVEEINIVKNDPQDLKTIKQTRKLHSVQSVGKPFEIDVRYSSCCRNCMKGNCDKCIYTNYVGQWNRNCLKKDGKSVRKKKIIM